MGIDTKAIRKAMIDNDIQQSELAKELGIDNSTLSLKLHKKRRFSEYEISYLYKKFGGGIFLQ